MVHFSGNLLGVRSRLPLTGSGCLGDLLRVPRPSASSFTCAEHPDGLIPATWYSSAKNKVSTTTQQDGGACQSEVKEEAKGRGTRTAAGTPALLRAQEYTLEHRQQDRPNATTNFNIR